MYSKCLRIWIFGLALLTACQGSIPFQGAIAGTETASLTPSLTPYTPMIMCTPPQCWDDEHYFCPAQCPGGCGTGCATQTPDPLSTITPTFPALAGFCTPPTPEPNKYVLPACVSAAALRVGESLNLSAVSISRGEFAQFQVSFEDADSPHTTGFRIRTGNHTQGAATLDGILALVSAQVDGQTLYMALKARRPGSTQIKIWAEGGIYSDPLAVTVAP